MNHKTCKAFAALFCFLTLMGCVPPFRNKHPFNLLVGQIWINEKAQYGAVKVIVTPDGILEEYNSMESEFALRRFKFTVTEKWIDKNGNLLFKSIAENLANGQKEYAIERIDKSGKKWETNFSSFEYPEQVNESTGGYIVFYRKE